MILRLCFFLLAATPAAPDEPPPVLLLRPPGGGYQPQAVAEPSGRIHVLAFVGDPAGGDLQYSWRDPATKQFSEPIRINSEPGSAVARGTMRGGQLALGRGGRVHVAWNGSEQSKTRNAAGSTPMLYARSNPERTAFEPQRNLMRKTSALDGGGSVAADRAGHVFVSWHGLGPDAPDGAVGRKLYVAKSDDDGATFADERPALARETGACPCCGTRSLADADGNLLILYRAAIGGTSRDMFLAQSHDAGEDLRGTIDPSLEDRDLPDEQRVDGRGRRRGRGRLGDRRQGLLREDRPGHGGTLEADRPGGRRVAEASLGGGEQGGSSPHGVGRGDELSSEAATSPGRCSTQTVRRSASRAASRGESRSGASRRRSRCPTGRSRSCIRAVPDGMQRPS